MKTQIRSFVAALLIVTACLSSTEVAAADPSQNPSQQVSAALAELRTWLGSQSAGWNSYLKLDELQAQLADGAKPNRDVVGAVLKQLQSGTPGLELPDFAKLRTALADWSAELAVAAAPNLSAAALSLEQDFQPAGPAALPQAKEQLQKAAAALDRFLTASPSGKEWREFLRWSDLQAQLEAETPDINALRLIYRQFTENQPGLEMKPFMGVATALERYTNLATLGKADAKEQYASHLKSLAEALTNYEKDATDEGSATIGADLGWLAATGQAPALVRAVRKKYSLPNLWLEVSDRLVAAAVDRPINEKGPITDNILGTSISGTAHTAGQLETHLLPDATRGYIETRLVATTATQTVGYNGPATIHSSGITKIVGSKWIVVDKNGLKQYRAAANAATATRINGVDAGGRLVQRIASQRVGESKGQAEQIAAEHAADRVRLRLDNQINEQLAKAQQNFIEKIRNPLLRTHEFPPVFAVRTTAEALFVDMLQANASQLGAPADNAAKAVSEHDLSLRVHQSWIDHIAETFAGGTTIKQEEVLKQIEESGNVKLKEKFKIDPEYGPWYMTLARRNPVTVVFNQDGLKITIRATRFRDSNIPMNITAHYKVEGTGPELKLVRQGEVAIFPPDFKPGDKLKVAQLGLRRRLQRRYEEIFTPEVKLEPLTFKDEWQKVGPLDWTQLEPQNGWVTVSLLRGKPASGEPVTLGAR